jgi:hypothetical protein
MHPTLIPNASRLLQLSDRPDGLAEWATELLARYDAMRGALGHLSEVEAEGARLDWQDAPDGKQGAAARQAAVRILRYLPGGLTTVARYLECADLDDLIARTWPGATVTAQQALLVEELLLDDTLARRQIALLANVTIPWIESLAGLDERTSTNRQVRALIAECHGDGLTIEQTRQTLADNGHEVPYKRVWETYKRLHKTSGEVAV